MEDVLNPLGPPRTPSFVSKPTAFAAAAPPLYKGPPSGVIVIDPGSFNLRIGLALEDNTTPHLIPQCIAWRRSQSPSSSMQQSSLRSSLSSSVNMTAVQQSRSQPGEIDEPVDIDVMDDDDTNDRQQRTNEQKSLRREILKLENHGMVKEASMAISRQADQLRAVTRSLEDERVLKQTLPKAQDAAFQFTEVKDPPEKYIVGEDALFLDETDPYDVVFPISSGRFNTDTGLSIPLLIDSLQLIWEWAIVEKLAISLDEITKYDVVIVIEDQFEQRFVFELLNLVLNKMCFRSAAIHKSSVCAAFGAGVTSCCVVDLGFSKTVVSCVEEADVISTITFPFGGVDLSRLMVYLLKDHDPKRFKLQYDSVDPTLSHRMQDLLIFEEMKESICTFAPEKATPRVYEFCVRHRDSDTTLYRVNVDTAQVSVPMALFYPNPLDILFPKKRPLEAPLGEDPLRDALAPIQLPYCQSSLPLQSVIVNAILSVPGAINQQKMFSRLLLIGGGAMLDGTKEMFEDIVFEALPDHVERVEVIPIQTGPTAQTVAWRGAAILGLQMPRAYWIDRGRWQSQGVTALRERLPFAWDRLPS